MVDSISIKASTPKTTVDFSEIEAAILWNVLCDYDVECRMNENLADHERISQTIPRLVFYISDQQEVVNATDEQINHRNHPVVYTNEEISFLHAALDFYLSEPFEAGAENAEKIAVGIKNRLPRA